MASVSRRQVAQTTAFAAVLMVALVGTLALVVDVGLLWVTQRELQKAADNAAMAGVVLLPANPTGAVQQANLYFGQNLSVASHLCSGTPVATITPGQDALPGGTAYTLTVTARCTAGFLFAQVVGNSQTPRSDLHVVANDCGCLRASATAVIGSDMKPGCPLPLAVSDLNEGIDANGNPVYWGNAGVTWQEMAANGSGYPFGRLVALRVDNQGATSGNFHAVQYGGTGGTVYENEVSNKCASPPNIQAGGAVLTQPLGLDMTAWTGNGLLGRGMVRCTGPAQPLACANLTYPAAHGPFDVVCPDNPTDIGPNDHSGVLSPTGSVKRSSRCLTEVMMVVPGTTGVNNQSQMQVEGFAGFFITGWVQYGNVVWGMFAKDLPIAGDLSGYDPLGTIVLRLIR